MRNLKDCTTLTQLLKESGLKLGYVAGRLALNRGTLRGKLSGEYEFKLAELIAIKRLIQGLDLLTDADFWRIVETEWSRRAKARARKNWIAVNNTNTNTNTNA